MQAASPSQIADAVTNEERLIQEELARLNAAYSDLVQDNTVEPNGRGAVPLLKHAEIELSQNAKNAEEIRAAIQTALSDTNAASIKLRNALAQLAVSMHDSIKLAKIATDIRAAKGSKLRVAEQYAMEIGMGYARQIGQIIRKLQSAEEDMNKTFNLNDPKRLAELMRRVDESKASLLTASVRIKDLRTHMEALFNVLKNSNSATLAEMPKAE